jgi:hypothetical protein
MIRSSARAAASAMRPLRINRSINRGASHGWSHCRADINAGDAKGLRTIGVIFIIAASAVRRFALAFDIHIRYRIYANRRYRLQERRKLMKQLPISARTRPMGRPPLNLQATQVRLSPESLRRIGAIAGKNQMAAFIREAVENELLRREGLKRRKAKGK